MKLFNTKRNGGKTLKMSKWVLEDTKNRVVVVGYHSNFIRLKGYGVPERNILLASNRRTFQEELKQFKEVGIDEVNVVLKTLLKANITTLTGTFENETI